MKVTRRTPEKDFVVVRVDGGGAGTEGGVYEIYKIEPVLLGTVVRHGSQSIATDDGLNFSNIESAAKHIMTKTGERELANKARSRIMSNPKWRRDHVFTARELVEKGKWFPFCAMRQLADTIQSWDEKFYLNEAELSKLGMTG